MTPAQSPSGGPPPRSKATLICQDCGRERHVDDWRRREDGDGVAVVCPECDHVLTRRPHELAAGSGRRGSRVRETLAAVTGGSRPLRDRLSLRD